MKQDADRLLDRLGPAVRLLGGKPDGGEVARSFDGHAAEIGLNVFVEGSSLGDVQVVRRDSGEVSHVRIELARPLQLPDIEAALSVASARRPGGEHGAASSVALFELASGTDAGVTLICHARDDEVTVIELRRDPITRGLLKRRPGRS